MKRVAQRIGLGLLAAVLAACGTFEIHIETQVVIGVPATTTTPATTSTHTAETSVAVETPTATASAPTVASTDSGGTPPAESPTPSPPPPAASLTPATVASASTSATGTEAPCGTTWFFLPRPAGCPAAAPEQWEGAAQAFERGFMLWTQEPDKFYVFLSGSQNFVIMAAPYQAGEGRQVTATPPPGMQAPVSGFDLVWRGFIATGNVNFDNLPERLGWAVEAEHVYTSEFQCRATTNRAEERCYLRDPAGSILYLTPFGSWAYGWE